MRNAFLGLALLLQLSPTFALAECGPFSSVQEAVELTAKRARAAEVAAAALEQAREEVSAEVRKQADKSPVVWRQAETSIRLVKTADAQPDVVRLVKAVYEPGKPTPIAEAVLQKFSAALQAASVATKARDDAELCLNGSFGIGPGHVNTVVLVGDESQLGYVLDPGPDPAAAARDGLIEKLRTECFVGTDIRRLGVSSGLANVTRVEGLTPFLDRPAAKPTPVSLTPDRAILVLAAEYDGRWLGEEPTARDRGVKLQCVRLMYLGQARITSLQLGTYGFGSESQNRIDLLKGPLSGKISGRLRDAMYVGIPVRKVMRYQTSRAAEDVLMDGQQVELDVVRTRTDLERTRTPAGEGALKEDTFQTSWNFEVGGMPRIILRLPVVAGLVLTENAPTGQKPVWEAGPALGLSYRIPVPLLGTGRYVAPEAFVHVGARIGDSEAVPGTLWGGGFQIDLSGYLGIGLAYMGDIRFEKPLWVFTIAPVPWISHALGLEKAVGN